MTLIVKAEGKGFEPSTGCPAPDFESSRNPRDFPRKPQSSEDPGAEAEAVGENPPCIAPELATIIDVWPALPTVLRAGILAMVQAVARHLAAQVAGEEEHRTPQ